jgi:hypothetical protein
MQEARAKDRSLRQGAELVLERHRLEVSHMTIKRVLEDKKAA